MNGLRTLLLSTACLLIAVRLAPAQSATSGPRGGGPIPSIAPTPEETLLLELINAARMNPNDGPEPAAQPLVFDPALMRGARNHSYYQTLHGMSHNEQAGREGFTGASPWDRVGSCTGENCYSSSGGLSAGGAHAGWMNSAGHRANCLNGSHRIVGLAMESRGHNVVTAKFGDGNQRYAGGVVYCDYNGNGRYDVNEGIGNAVLRYGDRTFQVCASGAYAIPISSQGGEITIVVETMVGKKSIPSGSQNYKLDFVPSSGEMIALQQFWEDQERLIQAIQGDSIETAEALCRQMQESYGRTRMGYWFEQAQNCLEMRKTYMQVAELYQQEKPPSVRTMNRLLTKLRRMQRANTTRATWDCGMVIGEAFYKLGSEGIITEELLRSDPAAVVAAETAEDTAPAEEAQEAEETQYYFAPDEEL